MCKSWFKIAFMWKEKILHADDTQIARDGMRMLFEIYGSHGKHKLLPQASSKEEIEEMMKSGLRPTVAILDKKMPGENDGEEAANIIRKYSPDTVIISLSSVEGNTFGDYNFSKTISGKELFEFITNLKH